MPELRHAPHSYREDPGVPAFDDSRALFVFDGTCVLCSGGAAFVMRHDRHAWVNFTPVRSNLGQALCRHYAVEWNETYLLVEGGARLHGKRGVSAAMWPARGRMAPLAGGRHRARALARCGVRSGRAQPVPLVRQGRTLRAPHARAAGEAALTRPSIARSPSSPTCSRKCPPAGNSARRCYEVYDNQQRR